MEMNCTQMLTEYLLHQFPWWRGSQLRYEPASKTVYVYCKYMRYLEILLHEVETISRLDIGVERFIVTVPHEMDMVVKCQPNSQPEIL